MRRMGRREGRVGTVGWNISVDIIYCMKVSLCNTGAVYNEYKQENREKGKWNGSY